MSNEVITDRQKKFIEDKYRRLQERLDSARRANYADGYDILGRLIQDAKNIRKTLIIAPNNVR